MSRKTIFGGALVAIVLTLVAAAVADAHDMFLKPLRYHIEPNTATLVRVLNGTFSKSENSIDRIRGVAENPRYTERVIAGAEFDFRLSLKVIDGEDLLGLLLRGLKLLESDSLGGSGSRGYGKVALANLMLDGDSIQARFDAIQPFAVAA